MNINVAVTDANNIVCEVTPTPTQLVTIDRGVVGNGIVSISVVLIDGDEYLHIVFTNGTTSDVGPISATYYTGTSPIVVNNTTNVISLDVVPISLGGTNATSAPAAIQNLLPTYTGNSNKRLGLNSGATGLEWVTDGGGTVTSVNATGGTTGLVFGGGPITTSGTLGLSGTLAIASGGTGQTTANAALNALLPTQSSNANKYLQTDGTNATWDAVSLNTADITGTLAIANGGTGGTTALDARTNLNAASQSTTITAGTGLSGGGDLTTNRTINLANTTVTAAAYGSASNTLTATVNAQGQLTALAATPIAIANTQVSGLGTMSTQNANAVSITGGSITGITDLAVADGGTGASDASGARTNLGAAASALTITAGTGLTGGGDLTANRTIAIANTAVTAGAYGSASNTLTATVNAQGQLTALAATPIAIANTQVSGLGTMSTQNSNSVTITGGSITGITDLAIADGGTGSSTASGARSNLGLGTAAVLDAGVALGVATLDASGTVPLSQIPASIQGGVSYQGSWNAATNTPTLISSVGTKGFYYVVATSGATNLNGITDWLVGDWAIFNGSVWQKIDNTDSVASVNGYTGAVVLTNTDVGAPSTSLTISAGTGLSGGGNLTTNRTLSIANTAVTAASYGSASVVPTFTVNGQGQLTASSDVTIAIANTQVSGLGTMSTQNANSVAVTGGSITGITDLAIADGGTGASTASGARTNLGLGTIATQDASNVAITGGTISGLSSALPVLSGGTGQTTYLDGQLLIGNTTGNTLTKSTLTAGSGIVITNGNGSISIAATGSGTVTSVTGTSPIVSSGGSTPAISLASAYGDTLNPYASKTANYILAAPNGTAGVPTFRAVLPADIPTLNQNTTGTAGNVTGTVAVTNGGTGLTSTPANGALDIGNGTGFTRTTLTAGANITITNSAGGITIASAAGSSATPITQNLDQVTANQTIASGSNGFSVGPITVASGYSVTVASGQRWVII